MYKEILIPFGIMCLFCEPGGTSEPLFTQLAVVGKLYKTILTVNMWTYKMVKGSIVYSTV